MVDAHTGPRRPRTDAVVWVAGHRLELPFHLVDQNREVFTRKSSFVVIFILAGDLVGIVCCLGAFNREEDVVFGYVHFINTECCILSIRTHGSQMTFV